MVPNKYDVCNAATGEVVNDFTDLRDAELWIAEQEDPSAFEIVPLEVHTCCTPLNLFLSHGTLTRNKK